MTPADITKAGGGEPFLFTYDDTDLAETFVFSSGNWGLFTADNVEVAETVRPSVDTDGVTSLAGSWTASVTLFHLDTFATARVAWEGTGVTVEYTLDGTTWNALTQYGVVNLSGDPDFDVRVNFAGGVEDDTAALTSLTVYVLATNTLYSEYKARTLSFGTNKINADGLINTASSTMNVSAEDPAPLIGTVELWVETQGSSTIFTSPPAGTAYKNGVAGSASAGQLQHYVLVLTTPANTAFTLAANTTISHLAFYPQQMTAGEVAELYAAQDAAPVIINDPSSFSVTEPDPAVDIYAYSWSIVSAAAS